MFSLFECKDGSFIVVPRGLAPPVAVYREHGPSIHVSDLCRHLYDTDVWDDISREVERQLYAIVHADVAFWIFDLPDPPVPRGFPPAVVPVRESARPQVGERTPPRYPPDGEKSG
jgi:hypothetical protein